MYSWSIEKSQIDPYFGFLSIDTEVYLGMVRVLTESQEVDVSDIDL